MAATQQQQRVI